MKMVKKRGIIFVLFVLMIFLMVGSVIAPEPDEKYFDNPSDWKNLYSEKIQKIPVGKLFLYPEYVMQPDVFKKLNEEQVNIFNKEYTKFKTGKEIEFIGFDAENWEYEGEVLKSENHRIEIQNLPEGLKEIEVEKDNNGKIVNIKYVLENGEINLENGGIDKEGYLFDKDGEPKNEKWNLKGKATIKDGEYVFEKGAEIMKKLDKGWVNFRQFYIEGRSIAGKSNGELDFKNPSILGADTSIPGILRINSETGFLEGKNIEADYEGVQVYTARIDFVPLIGNVFQDSESTQVTEETAIGSLEKLARNALNSVRDSFVKAKNFLSIKEVPDIKGVGLNLLEGKINVLSGGEFYNYVDVTNSEIPINSVILDNSGENGNFAYFRSGDFFIAGEKGETKTYGRIYGKTEMTSNGMTILNLNDVDNNGNVKNPFKLSVTQDGKTFQLLDPEKTAVISKEDFGRVQGNILFIDVDKPYMKSVTRGSETSFGESIESIAEKDANLETTHTFYSFEKTLITPRTGIIPGAIAESVVQEIGKGVQEVKNSLVSNLLSKESLGVLSVKEGVAIQKGLNYNSETNRYSYTPKSSGANYVEFIEKFNTQNPASGLNSFKISYSLNDIIVTGSYNGGKVQEYSLITSYPNTNPDFIRALAKNTAFRAPENIPLNVAKTNRNYYLNQLSFRR